MNKTAQQLKRLFLVIGVLDGALWAWFMGTESGAGFAMLFLLIRIAASVGLLCAVSALIAAYQRNTHYRLSKVGLERLRALPEEVQPPNHEAVLEKLEPLTRRETLEEDAFRKAFQAAVGDELDVLRDTIEADKAEQYEATLLEQTRIPVISPFLAGLFSAILYFIFSLFGTICMILVFKIFFNNTLQSGSLYHIDKEEGELQGGEAISDVPPIDIDELRNVAPLANGMTEENKDDRIAAVQALDKVAVESVRKNIEGNYQITAQVLDILLDNGVPEEVLQRLAQIKNVEIIGTRRFLRRLESIIGVQHTAQYRALILKYATDTQRYYESLKRVSQALIAGKSDPHKEVQYYSNDAAKKIGERYTVEIKKLLDEVNTKKPGYATYKRLADIYSQFAGANTEHPIIVKFYRQEAVNYYSAALEEDPNKQKEVLQELIPALYQTREYEQCLEYCQQIQDDPELASLSKLYTAGALFGMRRVSELNDFASQVLDSANFRLTDESLTMLSREAELESILPQLENLKNQRYQGAQAFLHHLESSLGHEAVAQHRFQFLKHAATDEATGALINFVELNG